MAGPYGSVGTDYREMQGQAEVNTDLPNNEAAFRAEELGNVFKQFGGESSDVLDKTQTQAGALAGAASGETGHPQYKQGFQQLTAYSQAFNNAATGSYAIEAEAQADDAAARLRVQANNNPATFQATYSAVRDGVLKNAPPMSVPMLTELYNRRLAEGLAAISGDQATQQRDTQRQTYGYGVDRQTSRVALLQGSANVQDQLQGRDEQVKLSLLIDGGVKSGLYSPAEAEAMHIGAARTITAQVFQTQVDRELARPDGGNVVQLLENFRIAHETNLANTSEPTILSEPEYQTLFQDASTKVREWNLTQQMARRDGKSAEEIKLDNGDIQYTSMLFQHTLTDRDLDVAVRNGDLKPETARALHVQIAAGPVLKTDPKAYASLTSDPNFLDMSPNDIADAPGVSNADKMKIYNEQQARLKSWEGTQNVKQAKASISAALKIPAGTPSASLSDEQRTSLAAAQQDFIQLMQGTDPAKRDTYAVTAAQIAVQHQQQREAAADVQSYTRYLQQYTARYGPGGSEPVDPKVYQERMSHYQDLIKQSQAAAKGN